MKRGPQVFDLPTANLHEHVGHYVPPRARNDDEVERRSRNPKGTVILEAQHDGVRIMQRMYELLGDDRESRLQLSRELGAVCLNTAWYSYANIASSQDVVGSDNIARRRLNLPKHTWIYDDGQIAYETEEGDIAHSVDGMKAAVSLAAKLERAHVIGADSTERILQRQFGRAIGNVGLRLAAASLIGQREGEEEPYIIQTNVRNAGTDAIKRSRELYDNAYPTLAQLPDPDSQLSVRLHRSASTPVNSALIEATDQVLEEQQDARAA